MKTVTLTTQISQPDFIKAILVLRYRRHVVLVTTLLMLFMLATNILLRSIGMKNMPPIWLPVAILLLIPILAIVGAIRQYRSNPEFSRPVTYTFDEESLFIKADKSDARIDLSMLFNVVESKKWLFIYLNQRSAAVVRMQDVSADQLHQLKEILLEARVKNNL